MGARDGKSGSPHWQKLHDNPYGFVPDEADTTEYGYGLASFALYLTGRATAGELLQRLTSAKGRLSPPSDPLFRARLGLIRTRALRAMGDVDGWTTAIAEARTSAAAIADVAQSLQVGAELELEGGLAALARGRIEAADTHLRRARDFGVAEFSRSARRALWVALALTSYVREELVDVDDCLRRADAENYSTAAPDPLEHIVRLLVATERGRVDDGVRARQALDDVDDSSHWVSLATAAQGYFSAREARYAQGLELFDRALRDPLLREPGSYWAGWLNLIRAFLLMKLDSQEEGWALLNSVVPDEKHALCPNREIAAFKLRLGDVRGAEAQVQACELLGPLHAPRSLAGVRWVRAAIDSLASRVAQSDANADLALLSMARNDSLAPLAFVPRSVGLELCARARTREMPVAELLDRADEYYSTSGSELRVLTPRELEVLALLGSDVSLASIAETLFISQNTLKTHTLSLYSKLGIRSRSEAAQRAQWLRPT